MKAFLSCGAALLGCCVCVPAWAEPPPRSLDQALVEVLSLGRANGCGPAFGVPDFGFSQSSLDAFLAAERDAGRIGKEIAAICGSSAVASAAALGGSLGSLQTTKTVSQFRAARNRADSRLDAKGKRAGLDRPILLAQAGGLGSTLGIDIGAPADSGPGLFVQASAERRDRSTTALEAGYRANIGEALVGVDYVTRDRLVTGAWVGYRSADADYRAANLLIGGANTGFGNSLNAALQAEVCKVGPGGGFDDKGARFGGFVAKRFGGGFADAGVQFSRRNYAYQRNVCAIEGNSDAIVRSATSVSGFESGGIDIDDIYAGTISGKSRLTEWGLSTRLGFDFGDDRFQWGPRVSLTYLHTTIGAYTETGRTSVTHTVRSNTPAVLTTTRAAGDPIGLELAFDRQRRTSLQAEVQLVAAYRHEAAFGTVVPRLALSWLNEFKGERQGVSVRMAQDRRADPTRFSFTTDSTDKRKGTVALGLSWLHGAQFAADIEVSRLFADDRFDSTTVAVQAVWRF